MNKFLKAAAGKAQIKLLLVLYSILLSSTVAAQGVGAVVESRPYTPGQSQSSVSNSPVVNSDALLLLLDQNRQLQSELQALRGLVEEQRFEIRKLQRDSLSRYTNTDERLGALETAAANPALGNTASGGIALGNSTLLNSTPSTAISTRFTTRPTTTGRPSAGANSSQSLSGNSASTRPSADFPTTRQAIGRSSSRNSNRSSLQPVVLSEQQLYQMAYDSVINSNFQYSIAEFDQYLSIYPVGRFVTNAHYWKGQAYLYLERFAEAKESYEIILNQFSDSPKLADAMYGLGLAYQGMGNLRQARQILNDIIRRFPNTGVANLADTRLLSLN